MRQVSQRDGDGRDRIIHLISTLDVGGAQAQLAKLLGYLDRGRFQHCVVSMTDIGPVGDQIQGLGIPVYGLGMKRTVPSLRAVWRLWRLLRRERPAILQTWLYHADLLGLVVGKAAGVPILLWNVRCSSLDMQHYPWLTGIVFRILSRLSSFPTLVISNSYAGRSAHLEAGYRPRRFEVLSNGFELERFRPDPCARGKLDVELGLPTGAVVIGLVARYDPMKDHATFFAAARKVLARHPAARFVLCGESVSLGNTELAAMVERHGLGQSVHLLGLRQDLPTMTAAFDLACSSSLFGEGFPNAVGEAMACGVPCVVTNVGDSAQIVGGTGRIVRPGDADAFAEALSELIACGGEARAQLGKEARARITQRYDIVTVARHYDELYASLRREADPGLAGRPLAVEGNIDPAVVQGFGDEWTRFDQRPLAENDLRDMFNDFFSIFPWGVLPPDAEGYDVGCGSGRWARFVAPRVGRLHCIDPSAPALAVARRGLERHPNCLFHLASVDDMPLADGSMDFGYALGVLHHLPDPEAGLRSCVSKLKAGAPFLLYLYYAFDNRPRWFRFTWRVSNVFRQAISRLPYTLRYGLSQLIAGTVYYPWARLALLLERLGFTNVAVVPLAWYRRRSFYTMRTDALDRFGTRLEKRFSAQEIACMMERAGLDRISFSPSMPFWCAVGYKKGAADIGKQAALRESATA